MVDSLCEPLVPTTGNVNVEVFCAWGRILELAGLSVYIAVVISDILDGCCWTPFRNVENHGKAKMGKCKERKPRRAATLSPSSTTWKRLVRPR